MSNKVLDTYYKNNRHIWVLVLSGAVIGTLVGLFATFFQLILDSISELKKMLFSLSGGNLFIEIIMSVSLTITMVVISILIVRKFAKEAGGSGIQEVEGALKRLSKIT